MHGELFDPCCEKNGESISEPTFLKVARGLGLFLDALRSESFFFVLVLEGGIWIISLFYGYLKGH